MSQATAVIAPVKNSFPSPYEQPAPAGAEGWKDLYAYNLVFQDNRRATEEAKFWFCDSQHWPTVTKPFETIGFEFAVGCLGQYNSRQLLIPTANGIEYRIHNGYVFMSPVAVDPQHIEARVPQFMQRAGHYFQNWESLLSNWHTKLKATIDELESIEFTALPDAIDLDDVLSGKGTGPATELLADYDRLIALAYRAWQYHFEFLNLGYVAYLDLFMFCKDVFPRIPDQAIATMVQGVDMELFRPDDELKKLAKIAVRDGLVAHFADTSDAAALLAAIAADPAGAEWTQTWADAQDPWFNFTTGNGFYAHDEYWRDVPETPLAFIKGYIERLQNGADIDRHVDALVAERDRITGEYAELLSGEVLETFHGKLGPRPHGLPLRREPQLLHRALDDGRLLAQGPAAVGGARRPGLLDAGETTCSTCAATRSARRCSTTSTAGWSAPPRSDRTTGRPRSSAAVASSTRSRPPARSRR